LRLFSFGGYGLVLAALALVLFGAYDSYPNSPINGNSPYFRNSIKAIKDTRNQIGRVALSQDGGGKRWYQSAGLLIGGMFRNQNSPLPRAPPPRTSPIGTHNSCSGPSVPLGAARAGDAHSCQDSLYPEKRADVGYGSVGVLGHP